MGVRLIRIMLSLVLFYGYLLSAPRAEAFVTTAGGETITWEFQGIPASNFLGTGNACGYMSATNYWSCNYNVTDPPYVSSITFNATIDPVSATFPSLNFYYISLSPVTAQEEYHLIRSVQGVGSGPLTNSVQFYLPASARKFVIIYSSDGQGTGATNIQLNIPIANYDYARANLLGGEEINADTEFCEENGQPGRPRIRKFRNKKGDGPGT